MQSSQSTQAPSADGKKSSQNTQIGGKMGKKLNYNHKTIAEDPKRPAMSDPC